MIFLVMADDSDLSRDSGHSLQQHIWAGIIISNSFHLISVLVLFRLLNAALGSKQDGRVPFIASVLHIMSPAALFLCSPYTEALFSALNFTGMLHYVLAKTTKGSDQLWNIRHDSYMLSSGILFAFATLLRGNGLLSGLIYLYDATRLLPRLLALQLKMHEMRRFIVTCVAGVFVASGFIVPQYLAYREYCATNILDLGMRPWCTARIPSIYTWVQSHYW